MRATVVLGEIGEAVGGVLRLTAAGVQDNVYVLDIGTLANPPPVDHPIWHTTVVIDDRHEGVDYGADSIIELSKGPDIVYARAGVDLVKSGLGDDQIYAGLNDDIVFAGGGQDFVRGGQGDDLVSGGRDDDLLFGEAGDDLILGNHDQDRLYGGPGDDLLSGQLGSDLLFGGVGEDELHGGRGDDELHGDRSADQLQGGRGGDELHGGPGNDLLLGGAGDDELHGGVGDDTLIGGTGADQFRVLTGDRDRVVDFRLDEGDTLFVDHVLVDDPLAWLGQGGLVRAPDGAPEPLGSENVADHERGAASAGAPDSPDRHLGEDAQGAGTLATDAAMGGAQGSGQLNTLMPAAPRPILIMSDLPPADGATS